MKDFCDRFGDPYGGRADLAPLGKPTQTSVSVDRLLQLQRRLRRALSLFRKGDASGLIGCWNSSDESALIRTELRAGSEGRLELALAPPDLVQAMWFQFAQFACSGAKLFRCERCNNSIHRRLRYRPPKYVQVVFERLQSCRVPGKIGQTSEVTK